MKANTNTSGDVPISIVLEDDDFLKALASRNNINPEDVKDFNIIPVKTGIKVQGMARLADLVSGSVKKQADQ